jgi:hypothetical protein
MRQRFPSGKFNELAKSLKMLFSVIPANPGSGPGQAPESSVYRPLESPWTPASAGATTRETFYEAVIIVWNKKIN